MAERVPWNAARIDGQALFPAGSDFPQRIKVFLQELLRSFVSPIQADTRIDGELSLSMIVDVFNVDSYCSERRCSNHWLLDDTGRTAGRESEVTFGENRERFLRMQLTFAGPGSSVPAQARVALAPSTALATRR
jgi:hypothetical protein